jgi:hypothetical protein
MCRGGEGRGGGGVGRAGLRVWRTDESRRWEGGMVRWSEGRGGSRGVGRKRRQRGLRYHPLPSDWLRLLLTMTLNCISGGDAARKRDSPATRNDGAAPGLRVTTTTAATTPASTRASQTNPKRRLRLEARPTGAPEDGWAAGKLEAVPRSPSTGPSSDLPRRVYASASDIT